MAQLQVAYDDLAELVACGKSDVVEKLALLGFPTEELGDGVLDIEVTPNRPDCLCVEGIARTLRCYIEGRAASYGVGRAQVEAVRDPSVSEVRPAFGCAVVRGISMSDSLLRSIMQMQEKLHETLGRKRRKVAIGIHDLDRVRPPFRYFACGREDIAFVPLEKSEKMTPLEILRRHEKGIAYAHLVGERCPMITDRDGEVLSFPPIINGELTKLTRDTSNLFIDCTGTNDDAVKQTVNILVSALAERGGKIEEVLLDGKPYGLLHERKWALPVRESERLLGVKLPPERVASLLSQMGYRIDGGLAYAPGYRADIMSEVDLIEDVAIAYGFNNFEPRLPEFSTIGHANLEPVFHELLVGLGFDEVITWMLSNPGLSQKVGQAHAQNLEIENPSSEEFTSFRASLLPNLLAVLSEGKNEKLPIRIYEIGPVALPHIEDRLAFASMGPRASFSEIKGVVLSLAESVGKNAEVKAEVHGSFLPGRCAALYLDGKRAGHFGEISPEVLSNFGLEQPVCAAEMRI